MIRIFLLFVAGTSLLLNAIASAQSPSGVGSNPAPYLADVRSVTLPAKNPSGLVFHEKRNSLLLVDNGGTLIELDIDLKEKKRWSISGDLEGIAVHPVTGTILVASERNSALIEFDLEKGKELRRFIVALGSHPEFLEDRNPDKGIEGVALTATGDKVAIYVVSEVSPPRLLRLAVSLSLTIDAELHHNEPATSLVPVEKYAMIEKGWDLGTRSLNDLAFDITSQTFLATSARDKSLQVIDSTGKVLRSFELPGPDPSGFCFLPNGDALVVHVSGGGQLLPGFRELVFPAP